MARGLPISDVGRAVGLMSDQQREHLGLLLAELETAERLVAEAERTLDQAVVALDAARTVKQRRLDAIESLVAAAGGVPRP